MPAHLAEVLLFHRVQGLTAGCLAFADELRAAGHVVHAPDLDLDAARELDETVESAELFLYPGDRHLFADDSLPDYDEDAAALLTERALSFLGDIE
jgi:dienelactone hydrolase